MSIRESHSHGIIMNPRNLYIKHLRQSLKFHYSFLMAANVIDNSTIYAQNATNGIWCPILLPMRFFGPQSQTETALPMPPACQTENGK